MVRFLFLYYIIKFISQFSVKRGKLYILSSISFELLKLLSRSLLYRGSKNGVGSAARSPVECIPPRATTKIRLSCLRIFILVTLPRVHRSWSRVNEHACWERRVEASSVSASETKRNRNTCVPRADGGTRAHALWPLWILSLSPFSSLFSFSYLSLFSFFLSLFCPSFFTHAILHTRLPRFHWSTESATGVLLLAANRHERSIRSLLVFGPILCDDRECKERFSSTW